MEYFVGRAVSFSLSYRQNTCKLSGHPTFYKKRAGNLKDTVWLTRIPALLRSQAASFSRGVRIAAGEGWLFTLHTLLQSENPESGRL
jgi:hypothetical protein